MPTEGTLAFIINIERLLKVGARRLPLGESLAYRDSSSCLLLGA